MNSETTEQTLEEFAERQIEAERPVTVVVVAAYEKQPQHGEEESKKVADTITPDRGRVVTLDTAEERVENVREIVETFRYTLPDDPGREHWKAIRDKISRQRLMQMNAVVLCENPPRELLHAADVKAIVAENGGIESVRRIKHNPYEHNLYEVEMTGVSR